MTRPLRSLVATAALCACATIEPTTIPPRSIDMTGSTQTTNKHTIRRLYEGCINEGALHLLDELVSADYVGPRGEKGPAGFTDTVRGLRSGVPDIHFTIEELVAEGDAVVVHWIWRGTHTGVLNGFAPSNESLTNPGIALYHLKDGKIVRGTLQTDRLGLLQQIGVVPRELGASRAR